MHAINHRLDHFGESLGQTLRGLLGVAADWLALSLAQLAALNAAGRVDDDIAWDDGEPDDKR